MKSTILFGLAFVGAWTAEAQVLPFNESGVTMGHHHLLVPDVDAQKKIWVDALGGQLSGNGPLTFVKFPGVFVILTTGKGTEGTKGSAIDHIAFNVKDLKSTRAKLATAGAAISNESDARFDAVLPGGIEVHFFARIAVARAFGARAEFDHDIWTEAKTQMVRRRYRHVLEDGVRRPFERDEHLGRCHGQALAGPNVDRHARPSP